MAVLLLHCDSACDWPANGEDNRPCRYLHHSQTVTADGKQAQVEYTNTGT